MNISCPVVLPVQRGEGKKCTIEEESIGFMSNVGVREVKDDCALSLAH